MKVRKRVEPMRQVPTVLAKHASSSEQAAAAKPEAMKQMNFPITKLPATRRLSPIKSTRHQAVNLAGGKKPDAIKPAIALAGHMNTKVVVISVEQLQRERERAAHSALQRPRLPAAGLSGSLAFAALFKDVTAP
jgi:hypothetical protein